MKTIILINGKTLFRQMKIRDTRIDHQKMTDYIQKMLEVKGARRVFFTGVDSQNVNQGKFLYWLKMMGFEVVTKPITVCHNGGRKVDITIEIIVQMMKAFQDYERVVIVGGTEHMIPAIEGRPKDVFVTVAGFAGAVPARLISAADHYLPIDGMLQD